MTTPHDPRPRLEQVDLLYRNAPAGIAAGVVIALFAYFFLQQARMAHAETWLAASLAVSGSRAWLVVRYRRRPPGAQPDAWFRRYAFGVFAAGATWGALGIGFFPLAPSELQIGIALIVAGMTAGAIAVFAVSAAVFAAFMLPALLPLIATLALLERPLFQPVAFMGAIFIGASLAAARNTARALNQAIVLRFEHEDAVRRLAAGELHLRMLGENVPAFIAHFDGAERLRHCNTAYAALFGEERAALLGRHARDILGAERYDSQAAAARRALEGESQHYRTTRTAPDGSELVLDVHRAPFRDEHGAIDGYYVFATDVTAEMRLQDALRSSESRMRLLLQSLELSGEAIFTKQLDGVITSWNEGAERLYGYTAQEAIGRPQLELYMSNLTAAEHEQVMERIRSGRPAAFEARRRRKDGSEVHVLVSTSPIFDAEGRLVGETTLARDITAMKLTQLALARAERELRLLVDNTPAMICYVGRDYRYRLVNKAYAELYGKTTGELLGQDFRSVLSEEMVARAGPFFQRALQGEAVRYERRDAVPGKEPRDLVVQYVPDFGDDGQVAGAFTLLTDVTEIKRVDRLKGEFVSTVSHELRTPLTSIRGSLGILAAGGAGSVGDDAAELVEIARKNCERLTRLIDDLLDIDKMEAGRMQFDAKPADLMSLVDEAVRQNAGYATEHGVTLRTTDRVAGARVVVDTLRFGQLMANLISNAAKYSPSGEAVEVGVQARDGWYRVSVRDHGPGIDPAFRSRIFQRFSQGDSSDTRRVGGTGLGLAIARSIVEHFGGAIDFDSEQGRGATFHFDLPAAQAHG